MAGGQTITISVQGDDALRLKLGKLSSATRDMGPVMGDIGKYLMRFFSSEVFASRGGVIGEPWPQLNARYAAYKAKQWPGRPPLVRTGVMQRSFKYEHGASFARISNRSDYFDYHQLGTSKMPQRMMMKVDEARARELGRLVERYLESRVK